MGMFDTIIFENKKGEKIQLQFKNGQKTLDEYYIGDDIDIADSIYFGHEGAFVVFRGKIVAAFDKDDGVLFDKWNNNLDFPDIMGNYK
jgi:hypothetical protein